MKDLTKQTREITRDRLLFETEGTGYIISLTEFAQWKSGCYQEAKMPNRLVIHILFMVRDYNIHDRLCYRLICTHNANTKLVLNKQLLILIGIDISLALTFICRFFSRIGIFVPVVSHITFSFVKSLLSLPEQFLSYNYRDRSVKTQDFEHRYSLEY